jgi:hypothetical protein
MKQKIVYLIRLDVKKRQFECIRNDFGDMGKN